MKPQIINQYGELFLRSLGQGQRVLCSTNLTYKEMDSPRTPGKYEFVTITEIIPWGDGFDYRVRTDRGVEFQTSVDSLFDIYDLDFEEC